MTASRDVIISQLEILQINVSVFFTDAVVELCPMVINTFINVLKTCDDIIQTTFQSTS